MPYVRNRCQGTLNYFRISWLFLLCLLGVLVVTLTHLGLLWCQCRQGQWTCIAGLFAEHSAYRELLLAGAGLIATATALLLCFLRRRGETWRMRYAIGWLVLIGAAIASVAAYHWQWLQGDDSPSATIRNIGLAVAAVLTLVFVIWRERIASNQASNEFAASLADRYREASEMIASNDRVRRIAGIRLIRELGMNMGLPREIRRHYRFMCLDLLNRYKATRRTRNKRDPELQVLNEAIQCLEKCTHRT